MTWNDKPRSERVAVLWAAIRDYALGTDDCVWHVLMPRGDAYDFVRFTKSDDGSVTCEGAVVEPANR